MVDQTNANAKPTAPTTLSDKELRALAYFAMGVGSESAIGGKNVAYDLEFAGDIHKNTGVMEPKGNSGYSLGTIQTDLGQHPETVPGLVNAYQAWARENAAQRPDWELTEQQRTQTIADLRRTGNTIKGPNKESIIDNGVDLDATIKSRFKTFLAADAGITHTHGRDEAQIDHLMRKGARPVAALESLQSTMLYQNSTFDDQARLATIFLKLENQSGARHYPNIITDIKDGAINSFEGVKLAAQNGKPDYVKTGIDHALEGTKVFNALRNANEQSPLHQTWQNILADPLVNPTQLRAEPVVTPNLPPRIQNAVGDAHNTENLDATRLWQPAWQPESAVTPPLRVPIYETNPNIAAEYITVKNLFLQPDQAVKFIDALDRGGAHSYGRPQIEGNSRATSGFYASGNDFVQWNAKGEGSTNIGGIWSELTRNDLTRVKNPNGTTDLNITENGVQRQLLHVDPNAPALRPAQATQAHVQQQHPLPAQVPINQIHPGQQQQGAPRNGPPAQEDPRGQDPRRQDHPAQQEQHNAPLNVAPPLGQPRAKLDPRDRNHPDHALYQQALMGVHQHDAKLGRMPDEKSEQMAASLTALAKENGMTRIDHVVFNVDNGRGVKAGENVFVVQGEMGNPAADRAHMKTDVAVNTSVQNSFQKLEVIGQQQAQEAQQQQSQQQAQVQQQAGRNAVHSMG